MTEKQDGGKISHLDVTRDTKFQVVQSEGSLPSPAPENEKPHGESCSPVSPTPSELSINEEILNKKCNEVADDYHIDHLGGYDLLTTDDIFEMMNKARQQGIEIGLKRCITCKAEQYKQGIKIGKKQSIELEKHIADLYYEQGKEAERKRIIESEKVFLICSKCGFKGEVKFDDIVIHKNGHCLRREHDIRKGSK